MVLVRLLINIKKKSVVSPGHHMMNEMNGIMGMGRGGLEGGMGCGR